MQKVCDFLKKCKTYYLATVDGSAPRVRPFGTANIFGGKLYFQTGKVKQVSRELHAYPLVEICAFDGEKWLRISAQAVEDSDIEAQKSMLAAYPGLAGMYKPGDGNTEVWYLRDAKAVFSSFTAPSEEILF